MSADFICFVENLVFIQGGAYDDTKAWAIDGVPVDLTGVAARMQVRATADAADPPLVDINSTGGTIVVGGTAGTVRLIVADTVTATLAPGEYVYDVALTWPSGLVQKFLRGAVTVLPGVTR